MLSISQIGPACLTASERPFLFDEVLPRYEVQWAPAQIVLSDRYGQEAVGYLSLWNMISTDTSAFLHTKQIKIEKSH